MKIPTTLKHKPVILSEDYEQVDGRFAGHSDAKGLSLGLAQWNDRGQVDISAKVWRHTGEKWSRQSEELPLHRVIDLCLLICRTKGYFMDAYRYPKLYDEAKKGAFDRIGIQGGALNVAVCRDNPMLDTDIQLFRDVLARDDELLSERLHVLANLLQDMGYGRRGGK
jgi:hypothetical protein